MRRFGLCLSIGIYAGSLWAGEGMVHANLTPFSAFVCESVLNGKLKNGMEIPKGPTVKVTVTHVSSYKGEAPTFAVMAEDGSTFNYVPPSALLFDPEAIPLSLARAVYQNSPAEHISLTTLEAYTKTATWVYMRSPDGRVLSEPQRGQYLFTLDWPSDNVLLHAVRLDTGHLVLYPPSKIRFADVKPEGPLPDWKKLRATWIVGTDGAQDRDQFVTIPFKDILAQTTFDNYPSDGTKVVPINPSVYENAAMQQILWTRLMPNAEFIANYASGTLRKNEALGFASSPHRNEERIAFEFGYGFESLPASYITLGKPLTEGDTKPLTELGWHLLRAVARNPYPHDDIYQAAYLNITGPDGEKREGAGIILRQTSFPFVSNGHLVFCLVAQYDPIKKVWLPTVTP